MQRVSTEQTTPTFFSLEEYEIHLANVHFDLNMYECANCIHAKFPTETTLITHFRQQHKSEINIKITYFLNPERIRKRQQIRQIVNKCAFELKGQSQINEFSQEQQQEATPEAEEEEVVELSDGVGDDPKNLSSPSISRRLKTEIMANDSSTGSIEPNGMSTPKSQRKMPSPSRCQRRRLVRKSRRISQNRSLSNLSAGESADCSFTWMDNSETTHRSSSPPVLDKQPSMSEEQTGVSRCASFTGSERIVVDDISPERPTPSSALVNTAQLMQSIIFENHVPNSISSGLGSAFLPVRSSQLPPEQGSSKYIVDIAPHQLQTHSALTTVTTSKKANAKLKKARTPYQMFSDHMINDIKKKPRNQEVARQLWKELKDKSHWINKSAEEKVRFEQGYLSIQ
uniref:C2H2-type domain-containing protein n=1 Tax=Ditylenchus dipsaci TaxID=166011 RepID=A0A915ELI4_9BILA